MGRPSNTEQRKQEIVAALLQVMANVGYEKASIQSIAKQAGLAPGLIHYHFKTKQDILIAAIHWIATSAEQRLQTMLNGARDPWEKLKAFVYARLATGETQMPQIVAAWIVVASESIKHDDVRTIYQSLIKTQLDILSALIVDVWTNKIEIDDEVTHLSAIIVSAIEGAFQLSVTAPDAMPKDYAAESVIRLIESRLTR
ncbi:hypothetical protein KUL42_11840 [Alteromonas sp. KUL42]|uniref:TetR/AcrR family transcriptional regulator n=1 Tax=Alteromonas sp. KUL42 TaxID=2480797 RepID=UPI0010356780|nr:TetR/AcrR family transcriptional regulator [Alteromonas sp. KUL42]TAP37026.1 TetR/AcrR family transcriptional regulator [Alteromonas sp. KUL42]GEA06423.1 hypothetical protein KUL42_11840 [Alteromonas sp. KUL42]